MKIVIIGAGIAGTVMALACIKKGMQVTLYEKSPQVRNIGGGVILYPYGVRHLQKLDIYHDVTSLEVPVNNLVVHNVDGQQVMQDGFADLNQLFGGSCLPVERTHFQNVLLKQLPVGTLVLNKQCIALEEYSNHVGIFFPMAHKIWQIW